MAQAVFQNAFPLRNPYLQSCIEGPRLGMIEGTAQVYEQGSPLKMDGANGIVVCTVDTNIITAALGIMGFAEADASGVAGTEVGMRIPLEDELWVMNYKPSSGDQFPTTALLGDRTNFDVYNESTGKYFLVANPVSALATNPNGIIVGLWTSANYPGRSIYASTDLNCPVVVRIKKGLWQ